MDIYAAHLTGATGVDQEQREGAGDKFLSPLQVAMGHGLSGLGLY